MNYNEILDHIKEKYSYLGKDKIIEYIYNLILIEYLRYNTDISYFQNNFHNILSGNNKILNPLDKAIEQSIFITLGPLSPNIKKADTESTLLSWSGFILKRSLIAGEYPKNVIHYFENDEEIDFACMSKEDIREEMEYDMTVSFNRKPVCARALCERTETLMGSQADLSENDFFSELGIINYRFIRIHPFYDGNGRVSRMFLNYILANRDNTIPIGLDNNEINQLIKIYKSTSRNVYHASMGSYLSDIECSDSGFFEVEDIITSDIAYFFQEKEKQAQKKLSCF